MRCEPLGANMVLVGANGAGKTNVLEAVSFLSPGRGIRRARLNELDCQTYEAPTPWTVAARIEGLQGEVTIGTGRTTTVEGESDRRIVRIDGVDAKSHYALADHTVILWLTPQMDQVWQEGESGKRRLLDRLVYAFDSDHATRVNAFELAMRERNRLLAQGYADPHWLDALEQRMAENAAAIAAARLSAVESLQHVMEESTHSFPRAGLALSGFVEDLLQAGESALMAEQHYAEKLLLERKIDAGAGRTLSGTHRTSLTIRHLSKKMDAEFCSTGEQKALLLTLVLAQARACAKWKAIVPLMLLDEVAAHLDEQRRAELFEETRALGAQVIMTGTDEALFDAVKDDAIFYRVEHAQVMTMDRETKTYVKSGKEN